MIESNFYKLRIGMKVLYKGEEKKIDFLDGNPARAKISFDNINYPIPFAEIMHDLEFEKEGYNYCNDCDYHPDCDNCEHKDKSKEADVTEKKELSIFELEDNKDYINGKVIYKKANSVIYWKDLIKGCYRICDTIHLVGYTLYTPAKQPKEKKTWYRYLYLSVQNKGKDNEASMIISCITKRAWESCSDVLISTSSIQTTSEDLKEIYEQFEEASKTESTR
jgi:hypothetical protein